MGSDLGGFGRSIDDHDHFETVVGTKARLGGCMRQTEGWDMTKGGPLALTLMNYEQTNFASDGRGVTVPAFQNSKNPQTWEEFATRHYENVLQHICQLRVYQLYE